VAHLSIRRPYLPSGRPLERSLPKPTSCHSKHLSALVVLTDWPLAIQAYKHVFTSPSSADDDEPKATKSGNARIHGMTTVTKASLAYIATQVRITIYKTLSFAQQDRCGFCCALRAYFRERILSQTPKHYTLASLACSRTLMRRPKSTHSFSGEIGKVICLTLLGQRRSADMIYLQADIPSRRSRVSNFDRRERSGPHQAKATGNAVIISPVVSDSTQIYPPFLLTSRIIKINHFLNDEPCCEIICLTMTYPSITTCYY
jgi:hypothetical protein